MLGSANTGRWLVHKGTFFMSRFDITIGEKTFTSKTSAIKFYKEIR